jgi:hypothetical protein
MRFLSLLFLGYLVFLTACGDPDPCVKTELACLDRETPDNLVMDGEWEGLYHVDRHMLGTNGISMKWHGDTYSMRVERDGWYRDPFYNTSAFRGFGSLEPNQTHFRAKYRVDEVWRFYGKYYLDDQQIVFKGTIRTNGKTIGDFRMVRNRKCTNILKKRQNVCLDELDTASITPTIDSVTVAPNPVSAGTQLRLEATAAPAAEWRWTVSLVPITDPTVEYAVFTQQAETFSLQTTAPSVPGEYAVRFNAEGNDQQDEREHLLEVR